MRPASRGFTLVELLVALTLASLVAMLAYGGLHVALRSWQAAELRQQQMELKHLSQALLRRLLESPLPLSLRDDEGIQQAAFYGESEQLIFVAYLPALGGNDQRYWVQLVQERQLVEGDLSWRMELRYQSFVEADELNWALLAESLASDGERQLLMDAMPGPWAFDYLERRADTEQDWQGQWRQRAALPVLLRMSPPRQLGGEAAALLVAPRNMAYAIFQSR
jgi:general secretion pathway protein J